MKTSVSRKLLDGVMQGVPGEKPRALRDIEDGVNMKVREFLDKGGDAVKHLLKRLGDDDLSELNLALATGKSGTLQDDRAIQIGHLMIPELSWIDRFGEGLLELKVQVLNAWVDVFSKYYSIMKRNNERVFATSKLQIEVGCEVEYRIDLENRSKASAAMKPSAASAGAADAMEDVEEEKPKKADSSCVLS